MNKILKKASILFLISFSLIGCTSKEQRLLKDVEKYSHINYLTDGKILFSYSNITGFEDKAGPVYYVLDYSKSDKKDVFINTYFDKTGSDNEFDTKLREFIEREMVGDYASFDSKYKINFDAPRGTYRRENLFMIYYPDTDVSYFIYHLWIP